VCALWRVADGVAAGVSAAVQLMNWVTAVWGLAVMILGVAIAASVINDALNKLRRRLDSIERYLESESASRRPTTTPPPPPPFVRVQQ